MGKDRGGSSGLQKFPGLSMTPEAFFQDPVIHQRCLNIKTNSSYYGVWGGPIFKDFPWPGNFTKRNPGLSRRRGNPARVATPPGKSSIFG